MRTQTIRCGYGMWSPVLYRDMKTNALNGFAYDLVNEIGHRLNLLAWYSSTME